MQTLLDGLHPLEVGVLRAFADQRLLEFAHLAELAQLGEPQCRSAVEWLRLKGVLEVASETVRRRVRPNAPHIPEWELLGRLKGGGPFTMKDLDEEGRTAAGNLRRAGAACIIDGGVVAVVDEAKAADFHAQEVLLGRAASEGSLAWESLTARDRSLVEAASRRRGRNRGSFVIAEETVRSYRLSRLGEALEAAVRAMGPMEGEVSALTPEMLRDGSWRQARFRHYYLGLRPAPVVVGRRHPYREFLDDAKHKLTSMGFEEMTGPLVESEFWNMDALFMPQFHAARDIHDAYYLKRPTHAREIQEPFLSRVARAHEDGGDTGSRGWRYAFDRERTRRLVLRSQGTALSARWLQRARVPGKYYAMARCFRYDQVDATHASEFFQVEGIVLGAGVSFQHLLGLLRLFALEVARAREMKFVPAYFPFTEPSVEVHILHPRLGWMELGGAGIFRPEVTGPQGVDVPVIAWGLGLDRMAMVALGIRDIRELFSPDLELVRSRTVCL